MPAFSNSGAEVLVVLACVLELDELLADRAQLLAKDVLALRVVDRLLDVLVDLAAQLGDFTLACKQRDQRAQTRDGVGFLEQRDAVVEPEIGTGAGDVRDQLGLRGPRHRHRRVSADLRPGVDIVGEQRSHGPCKRVDLGSFRNVDRHRGDRRDPGVTRRIEGVDANALLPLDQRVRTAAGQPPEGADMRDDGDGVHVVERRLIAGRVTLDRQDHSPIGVDGRFERCDRARPAGSKRRQLRREHHVVPERDRRQRQLPGRGRRLGRIGGRGLLLRHEASIAGARKHQTSIPSPLSQSRRQAAA